MSKIPRQLSDSERTFSGFNTGKAESARSRRLLAVMGGEHQVDRAPFANDDGACQMNGIQRLHDGGHGLGSAVNDRPGQAYPLDCSLYLCKLLDRLGNVIVIENGLQA